MQSDLSVPKISVFTRERVPPASSTGLAGGRIFTRIGTVMRFRVEPRDIPREAAMYAEGLAQSAETRRHYRRLDKWQAALKRGWLADHPGKTAADYEIAGSCSDGGRSRNFCFDISVTDKSEPRSRFTFFCNAL